MEKKFKCGTFILTNNQVKNAKGEIYMEADQPGRIMVVDPAKAPLMYGIRRDETTINYVYVTETDIRVNPAFP
ncbi:hypothetical protein, partial [Pseudomonas aeruginosa]